MYVCVRVCVFEKEAMRMTLGWPNERGISPRTVERLQRRSPEHTGSGTSASASARSSHKRSSTLSVPGSASARRRPSLGAPGKKTAHSRSSTAGLPLPPSSLFTPPL